MIPQESTYRYGNVGGGGKGENINTKHSGKQGSCRRSLDATTSERRGFSINYRKSMCGIILFGDSVAKIKSY